VFFFQFKLVEEKGGFVLKINPETEFPRRANDVS